MRTTRHPSKLRNLIIMVSPVPNERLLGGTPGLLPYFFRIRPLSATESWNLRRALRGQGQAMQITANVCEPRSLALSSDGRVPYFVPHGRTPLRRGYSHWSSAMVNAQLENSVHFSVRNKFRIMETPSNSGFEAHFASLGGSLQFCVVPGFHSISFAMQNI